MRVVIIANSEWRSSDIDDRHRKVTETKVEALPEIDIVPLLDSPGTIAV